MATSDKSTSPPITAAMVAEEAQVYLERWQSVSAREREELRATPPAEKLRQLASLLASVDAMGWRDALAEGEDVVRERWIKLRKAYGV
jgi:hypothetical protein